LIRIEESAFFDNSFLMISESILDRFRRRVHCQLTLIISSENEE
jgi:hypothetical protein